MAEVMFQNVANRATVYRTGCEAEGLKKKKKQSKVAFYMKTIENRSLLFTANDKERIIEF